ncbi:MAG: hypothetical protein NC245_17080 [Muribaculum sp.]|nr:hypothetical protein [Muribaculum sp.]
MLELYKRMYATLLGRVDAAIGELADIALLGSCDKQRVLTVAENLRQALLEVEGMYLDAEEEQPQ